MTTIKLTKADTKRLMSKRHKVTTTKAEPHCRKADYGVPLMRDCAFPDAPNPQIKRGKATPHPLKLWYFKKGGKK